MPTSSKVSRTVESKVVEYPSHGLDLAAKWATENCPSPVICTQVNGPQELVRKFTYQAAGQQTALTTSWQKEMWKVAGQLSDWDSCLPLTFDKRDSVREKRLLREVFPGKTTGKKPIMLLALDGKSSPFPHKEMLRFLLKAAFGKGWRIVELPQAARLYDLLALYDNARLLVAVDSAPLHLAWAVRSLPVIALANDKPLLWTGSPWRPNMVWYCRYGDWLNRWQQMLDVIDCQPQPLPLSPNVDLRVWSEYETRANKPDAFWHDLPISIGACGRDSAGILQDPKRVPYLRDCIRMAIQKARPGQVIVLTRPDIRTHDAHLHTTKQVAYSYRMQGDSFAPICDLFTAPREWWKEHLSEIPDLLLGNDYHWSEVLRMIFQKHGAQDVTGTCHRVAKQ